MPLNFHPNPGQIVLCDYSTGFIAPEMTKRRPVIIVSPRLRRRNDLVSVIPLSTTEPSPAEAYHCEIILPLLLPAPFDAARMWAKCDMIATVSLGRLDRFRAGRTPGAMARRYVTGELSTLQLRDVKRALLHGLGLSSLTQHL